MANRALVTTMGSQPIGGSPPLIVVTYLVLNSGGTVVAGPVLNFTVTVTYANMNNIVNAIQSAVQANENDSSLQVYVI